MATFNERGARVSPVTREHYDTVYGPDSLPATDDPGWADFRHRESGAVLRMIRVHGPFDVANEGAAEEHCQDGWLVTGAASGRIYAVAAAAHAVMFEAVS